MKNWKLEYNRLNPEKEGLREALCTLGNGYIATRGAAEESSADEVHYPGTYLAGGYNRLTTKIAGKDIENEDLVNWPNWLCLTFRTEDDDKWFELDQMEVLSYNQVLDIKHGCLIREMHFKDRKNRETKLNATRLVSMDNPHLATIKWEFKPINWEGEITVKSGLDGEVKNAGVKRYAELNNQHLKIIENGTTSNNRIFLLVQTVQSGIYMAQASNCCVYDSEGPVDRFVNKDGGKIFEELSFEVSKSKTVSVEKIVSIYTSRDKAVTEPLTDALEVISEELRFDDLYKKHTGAWRRLWNQFDVKFTAPGNSQLLLRLHIFHLLQTSSKHTIGNDTGIPARGWHGEAYRGHIFWDELFIFPLLNFRMPDLTRSLLLYRYHRLNAARKLARQNGHKGAMYPWQSGSNGREESQVVHLNPKSGKWIPDHTYLQRHVNLAIAYNIWQYYEVTGDTDFLKFYGAEMLLEIARLFADLSTWNKKRKRYDILKVVGPDEFHTAMPGSDEPGIDNNAYTNILTSWLFTHVIKTLELIGESRKAELMSKLELSESELNEWTKIKSKLFVPFVEDGIIAQFEGYEELEEFDWKGYRKKYGDIHRLDRLLDAEEDTVNNYKASKQADVLMLFYLFSSSELVQLFNELGYKFNPKMIGENIRYYRSRTSDGSTLSHIVSSWVQARSDRKGAWECFRQAVISDLEDVQGGTTAEGIHLGSMAGTVDIIHRGFTGLEVRDDVLWLDPRLPEEISSLDIKVYYRGSWLVLDFFKNQCCMESLKENREEVKVGFREQTFNLKPGERKLIDF